MTPAMLAALPTVVPAVDAPVADFSDTPLWLSLVKALFLFVYILVSVLIVIWFERRVIGRMQQRPGPNRTGPFGLLQSLADGLKSMLKEDVIPKNADIVMFILAPLIVASMAFVGWSIIPLGPNVTMFGHNTPLQMTDAPIAVLIVLAAAGISAYGFVLAGWSSGSTYPLLGGLRASAQVISYEIAMGLALAAVFLHSGTMSTSGIVAAQESLWFAAPLLFSFVIYLITMVGETNRLPFDLAEGEGELVGGYFTEYSGMKFAMFFLGEYINMFTVSALATTLFLGGWRAPWPLGTLSDGALNTGWWPVLWFTLKMWLFMFMFVWLRGSLPRVRYDQFMKFGWKFMIPATLVWVIVVAILRGAQLDYLGGNRLLVVLVTIALVFGALMALAWRVDVKRDAARAARATQVPDEIDPFAGGYPVPPMPGQRLVEPQPALARPTQTVTPAAPTSMEAPRG